MSYSEIPIDPHEPFWMYNEGKQATDNYSTAIACPEMVNKLYEAINKLSNRQREIIVMVLEGQTQTEIATRLGITQGSVNMTLNGVANYSKNNHKQGGIYNKLRCLLVKGVCDMCKEEFQRKQISSVRCVGCQEEIIRECGKKYRRKAREAKNG